MQEQNPLFILQITFLLHFCFPSTLGREEVFKYLLNEIITMLNKVNSWLMADSGTEPNVHTADNISSSFLYFICPRQSRSIQIFVEWNYYSAKISFKILALFFLIWNIHHYFKKPIGVWIKNTQIMANQ